jgi:predicted transcriptional regulator
MSPYEASEGKTVITIELRIDLVKHLDDRASYLDCSRAAYFRRLVIEDMEKRASTPTAA